MSKHSESWKVKAAAAAPWSARRQSTSTVSIRCAWGCCFYLKPHFVVMCSTCPQLRVLVAAETSFPAVKFTLSRLFVLSLHANDVISSDSVPVWAEINQMQVLTKKEHIQLKKKDDIAGFAPSILIRFFFFFIIVRCQSDNVVGVQY